MTSTLRKAFSQVLRKNSVYSTSFLHNSTDSKVLKSVFKDIEDVNYTINQFVWQNLDKWPDKTFTVCASTGHGYTYAQTHKMSVQLAASLRLKLKLQNDDTVAIILPNVPEYPCVSLDELKRQLEQINCKAIISSKLSYKNISEALKTIKRNVPVILIDNDALPEGTIRFAEFANDFNVNTDCLKAVKRSADDVAILPFSSGTTGFPKAVVSTHRSIVAFNKMIYDPNVIEVEEATATYQSVLPGVLPFFHIFGFNVLMLNLMCLGVKLVTISHFKPEVFLETIRNINFRQGYGLTETNGGISVGRKGDKNLTALGHVFGSCEVKIADLDTQETLGPDQEGEIWFRGPSVMRGYLNNEEANREVFTEDGWLKTGDIGKYDENKYLYITDRLKELIKVKAFQVPPAELEMVLRTHPKVLDCAVIAIKDEITGEAPKAFVVTKPKQTVDAKELMKFVNQQLATFKKIKELQFVDDIPKNPAELKALRRLSCSASLRKNEEFIWKSRLTDMVIPEGRFLDQLWINYNKWDCNHVALTCAETKKTYTYKELRKNIDIFATSLRKKLGLQEKDVICLFLPNSPEFCLAALGILRAGCIATTMNPIYKDGDKPPKPKVVITVPECYENLKKGLANAKRQTKIVILDRTDKPVPEGTIRFSEIAEKGEVDTAVLDKVDVKKDDVAFIPFSSGTTGLPKGVEITHGNLIASNEMMCQKENDFAYMADGSYQDVVPCILPFFHIYGLMVTLFGHISKGCKLITMSRFSPITYFDVLENEKPNLLYVVPPIVILLGKHPDTNLEFNQGFGATETSSLATSTFVGTKVLDYSACGEPMANVQLKFIDPVTGHDLPLGEQGELLVKSPTVMKGYHKNETATQECMTEDGFFKTGDLGYYKPGQGLFVKGMQVAPAELERVPHPFYGEVPKAFIIKKNGLNTSPEEIQNYVADQVAPFKKIDEVIFVNDIPKTNTGKILRKDLKKIYA
ncbi:unnamed protein product [Leptidea sinapis]|uniref:AMP-dependent synthetase/ligase domain-containing protein n=1 Tax=Leptidea sinapis TaxID=189913 RepID=A0A5E4QE12_9NEOP|nr:unnamed protein product [Leptidea sinapis]